MAARNRTMRLSDDEQAQYLARCLSVTEPVSAEAVLNRTICGDSFNVLRALPRGFADLVIADPPYNLRRDFGAARFAPLSDADYAAYTERWLDLVLPLCKETASVYVCCDWRTSLIVGPILARRLKLRSRITWQREKGRGARGNWKNALEDIWFATLSDNYTFHAEAVRQRRRVIAPYRLDGKPRDWSETPEGRFRDTAASNFWDDISIPYWSMPENTDHPTQKPEKLLAKLILASSDPGDVVLDPFLGSGSSAVTAKKLGRRYVGVEQDERWCALAEKRLALAETDRAIQGYTGGVFWERNTFALQQKAKQREDACHGNELP